MVDQPYTELRILLGPILQILTRSAKPVSANTMRYAITCIAWLPGCLATVWASGGSLQACENGPKTIGRVVKIYPGAAISNTCQWNLFQCSPFNFTRRRGDRYVQHRLAGWCHCHRHCRFETGRSRVIFSGHWSFGQGVRHEPHYLDCRRRCDRYRHLILPRHWLSRWNEMAFKTGSSFDLMMHCHSRSRSIVRDVVVAQRISRALVDELSRNALKPQ